MQKATHEITGETAVSWTGTSQPRWAALSCNIWNDRSFDINERHNKQTNDTIQVALQALFYKKLMEGSRYFYGRFTAKSKRLVLARQGPVPVAHHVAWWNSECSEKQRKALCKKRTQKSQGVPSSWSPSTA